MHIMLINFHKIKVYKRWGSGIYHVPKL